MNHSDNPTPLSRHAGRALAMLADDTVEAAGSDPRRSQWKRTLERLSAGADPASVQDDKVARFLELLEASSIAGPASDELVEPPVVIGRTALSARPARLDGFWGEYRHFLSDCYGWGESQISTLDGSTNSVLEQLADPDRPIAARTRGLVVGHVGSGKSAHFTGLIAKAVDAGYRLVIVVTGPLNLQRFQVQQGLERALLGDGSPDADGTATTHLQGRAAGTRPPVMSVTTLDHDYRSADSAQNPWDFTKLDPEQPLNSLHNLRHTPVRLLAVKRNTAVLAKLTRDLQASDGPLSELPTLVIDEEPNEAIAATAGRKGIGDNAADSRLVELLRLLPRAQYVNFSTTPFVRALLDPTRDEELFPRDFVAYLPEPVHYLRAHETNQPSADGTARTPLRLSGLPPALRTRVVDTGDLGSPTGAGGRDNAVLSLLCQAVDMFVLTGALKLYRQETGPYVFRHHTMLVHSSDRLVEQHQVLEQLRRTWEPARCGERDNRARLKALFEQDLLKHAADYPEGRHTPEAFEDLLPYIRAAAERMTRPPQLISGADEGWRELQDDFAHREVWGVLVGGTRIVRELRPAGLTISFAYPKRSGAAKIPVLDERFVNRDGYRDLLRYYIGHDTGKAELTEETERLREITRAEERFLAQLREIAVDSGHDSLMPAQLPALVAHHAPWRTRTRSNRIFNAELVEIRSPGRWVEHLARPARAADRAHNARALLPLLQGLQYQPAPIVPSGHGTAQLPLSFPAQAGVVTHEQLLKVLERLRWQRPDAFRPYLQYLRSLQGELDDWLVILPMGTSTVSPGKTPSLLLTSQQSSDGPAFPGLEDQRHRQLAERIVEMGRPADPDMSGDRGGSVSRRGVLFLHPMTDSDVSGAPIEGQYVVSPEELVMRISYLVPTDGSSQQVKFIPRNASLAEAPILAFTRTQEEDIVPQPLSAAV